MVTANNLLSPENKQRQEIFELTFEKAAIGIAHIDRDGRFLLVNNKLSEITGYTKDELLQKSFHEITHIDDLEEDLKQVAALIRGETETSSREKRYFRKDGNIVWVKLQETAVKDAKGDLQFFISITEDVSHQKRLEDSLRKSEQKFSKLFFGSIGFKIISNSDTGKFLEVNDDFCRLTGYSREELIGRSSVELGIITAQERDKLVRRLKEANTIELTELQITDRNGENHTVLFSARIIAYDGTTGVFSAGTDITRYKQVERELRDNEQRFKMAVDAANAGAYILNLKTGENYWSPEALAIYGLKPGDKLLMEDGIPAAVHPGDREAIKAEAQDRFKGIVGPHLNSEHRIVLPDGNIRWVSVRGRVEFDEEGRPLIAHGVVMDITERKQIEEQIRESESRFRAVQENSPGRFTILKPLYNEHNEIIDFTYIYQNARAAKTAGRRPEELPGLRVSDIFPAFTKSQFFSMYKTVIETGQVKVFEQPYIADGVNEWFRATVTPVPEGIAIATEIITGRKLAEEALRKSELRYRLLFENMSEGFALAEMIWDEQGNPVDWRYLEVNQAWGQTGIPAPETVGRTAREVNPDIEPYWMETYGNVVKTGCSVKFENYAAGLDKWFATYAFKHSDNHFAVLFHDITDRKRAEEALQESEEKFRNLANNMSQLAWMMDDKGWVFWYNKRWFDYTGTTLEDMKGWGWKKVHHPNHVKRVESSKIHSIESGEVWEELFPLRSKEGEYRWFLTRAVPLKNKEGKITRWLGTNTDITHQRNIELQLQNDSKLFEDLLHIAAHDLKGPLANLYTALDIMDNLPIEQKVRLLNQFRNLADQLNVTMKGVTSILRMRNEDKSAATIINVEKLLDNILLEFDNKKENVTIKRKIEIPVVHYIEIFLYSIIKNLVSNAIKYCREDVDLNIEIGTLKKEEFILLYVRDNGIGIDLKIFGDKLFSPFHRVGSKKAKGTGIGLYLIKDIVEKNGGFIEVESIPDNGSIFKCYLKEY